MDDSGENPPFSETSPLNDPEVWAALFFNPRDDEIIDLNGIVDHAGQQDIPTEPRGVSTRDKSRHGAERMGRNGRCTYMGGFRRWWGFPTESSILKGVFQYFHHPFWGPTPIFGNTHMKTHKFIRPFNSCRSFFSIHGASWNPVQVQPENGIVRILSPLPMYKIPKAWIFLASNT